MSASGQKTIDVFGATLTRDKFVKRGGALVVGFSVLGATVGTVGGASAADGSNSLDPSLPSSWLTINPDNTILMRTGKPEMGQGSASAAYAQILAEELNVPFSAITQLVMGDTDRTPDGGIAAGFLGTGAANLRKVGAYTYQALLSLASTQLGVPVGSLTVSNGVVSGGGKQVTYGQLVAGNQLSLSIPVSGNLLVGGITVGGTPPTKPVSQYTVIGTSQPMATIPPIATGTATFVGNLVLPGMLHARMVKPRTFGSTLISVGQLDKKQFPNTQVVVKGNLVGVLDPQEYIAIQAASVVASKTKWSDWADLPGSGNVRQYLRSGADYTAAQMTVNTNTGNAGSALATAAKRISATYMYPYFKHAPIGPSIAVADVRSDGTTIVWAHTQAPQPLRKMLSAVLQTDPSNVIVRILDGSGHYGRSNPGPDGAEADAVILSQAVGKPVRVQWMRPEDMTWAVSSFPQLADMQVGLDANNNMVAFQADYHQTGRYDGRGLGALLAGLPPGATEDGNPAVPQVNGHYSWVATASTVWPYDKVLNALEYVHNAPPPGQVSSPYKAGMRIHSSRTPVQRQANFALESIVNEAAATAGVDPIDYRLRHTTDPRLILVLNTLKTAHGWETRPSPSPSASSTGSKMVTGQGMGVMIRSGGHWAAAADITLNPKTGKVIVDKYTVVLEPGIVVNPLQMKRITEGGTVMGMSEALFEQVAFNKSMITSQDWVTYPILRFMHLPKINVVLLNNVSVGTYNGAGEGSNSLPPTTIAAAIFDATGKFARSLPFRPANVRAILAT
jgi:CO/xanthine dehydrogenase Mo-binding subunit